MKNPHPLFGEGFLPSNRVRDIAGCHSTWPHITLGKPGGDGIDGKAGKDHWGVREDFPRDQSGTRCDDDTQFQFAEFFGKRGQATEVAVGDAYGEPVICPFYETCFLQPET